MRTLGLALAIAALLGTANATATESQTARCADVGPPNTDVGLYHITATGTSCHRVRSVLRRWYYDASAPDAGPRGWRCHTRQRSSAAFRTTCRRDSARLGFTRFTA